MMMYCEYALLDELMLIIEIPAQHIKPGLLLGPHYDTLHEINLEIIPVHHPLPQHIQLIQIIEYQKRISFGHFLRYPLVALLFLLRSNY